MDNTGNRDFSRVLLLDYKNKPLRICSWKRALRLLLKGKAQCAKSIRNIEDYLSIDNTQIPKVIRLNYDVGITNREHTICMEKSFLK